MRKPSPVEVVREWVHRFNERDVEGLVDLYASDATNHQVVAEPVVGKQAIGKMFESAFGSADMECIVERIHDAGEWAILEWRDPKGLRGCGFFQVKEGRIHFQRGYWDQLTFLRSQKLPLPTA